MARELPAHMLRMPQNFLVLRIFQLVFSVFLMGLTIFGIMVIALNSLIITLFTAIVTAITTIYIISAQKCAPSLYNYWAILALEIFCLIFWLTSFSLMASDTATLALIFSAAEYCDGYGNCYANTYAVAETTYVAICGTAAGLGALEFVFFLISLIIVSVMLHRHRKNGGHCKYLKNDVPPPVFNSNNDEPPPVFNPNNSAGGEKVQMQTESNGYSTSTTPAPQQYYQPPQQHVQQNMAYAGAPVDQGQQYQPPQYPQQTPQQLSGNPAPTYTTSVQQYPPQ